MKRTTQVTSNIGKSFDHCNEGSGAFNLSDDITPSINHYIAWNTATACYMWALKRVTTRTVSRGTAPSLSMGHDNPSAVKPPATVIVDAAIAPQRTVH